MSKIRLNKALKQIASRRAAEKIIFEGRVMINGEINLLPQTMVGEDDVVTVDGSRIKVGERKVYFLLNKPPGYICTARAGDSKRVLDLFEKVSLRLFTVGRLDRDTSGLLLVTNDGDFANQIAHPSFNVSKEYLVKTTQDISDEDLKRLSKGTIVERTVCRPTSVKKVRRGCVKIVVTEGKKHVIRLLVAAAGLTLTELKRVRVGPLVLGTLPLGAFRELSLKELAFFTEANKLTPSYE